MIEMIEDDGNGNGNDVRARRWFSYLWTQMVFVSFGCGRFSYLLDPEGFHLDLELGSKRFSYLLRTMIRRGT